ncbi:hypothetical protein PoB_001586100 [Plakobranchus ocellatus]|uniref:Uncharacterized protein n=1 Tax=Plakobranchus ocellatus TaxID=259542 RepID=A0AAV3Z0L5_9GAST|nr:hypothetical protein PoB_001586100 [Plakobranchus ocellatus]
MLCKLTVKSFTFVHILIRFLTGIFSVEDVRLETPGQSPRFALAGLAEQAGGEADSKQLAAWRGHDKADWRPLAGGAGGAGSGTENPQH